MRASSGSSSSISRHRDGAVAVLMKPEEMSLHVCVSLCTVSPVESEKGDEA